MASGSKKVIYAALIGNSLIAITKYIAAFFTGSSAMMSEGIHSTVDTGNQILLLYGLHRAKKPADAQFPFGHGKEVYFWSFIVAILIFAVGSGISLYEGIHSLLDPHPVDSAWISYTVLTLAMVFEGFAWYFAFVEFKRSKGSATYFEAVRRGKDPTLFVVLFEDSAAMLGLVAALIGVALTQITGNVIFDSLASITIGLILGGTAIWLAYETKGLLIGESASRYVVNDIRKIINTMPEVEKVHEVLTMHMGPEFILANISIRFFGTNNVATSIDRLEREIKQAHPAIKRLFIEAEDRNKKD
ncbi:MAG TPA: cation diffusion facilitator family transporter [Gammaproteobacteria bacterium]|nr:cation diffusion facilitator family transporter [Gammaproteobacteria bacterium]